MSSSSLTLLLQAAIETASVVDDETFAMCDLLVVDVVVAGCYRDSVGGR